MLAFHFPRGGNSPLTIPIQSATFRHRCTSLHPSDVAVLGNGFAMKIALVFLVLLPELLFAQQRYLVSPSQEVIPLSKSQSAAYAIKHRLRYNSSRVNKISAACS